jgi:hypothetical protein
MSELQLYWVTTEDHDEDWFVVAADPSEAARSFELNIGYEAGSAIAEKVLDIPPDIQMKPVDTEWFEDWPDWPSDESLIALGAIFISDEPSRVVEICGNRYTEGSMDMTDNDHLELSDGVFGVSGRLH